MGWVVNAKPRPLNPPVKETRHSFLKQAGFTPGPVWTGAESLPHPHPRTRFPDRPALGESLDLLRYPAHILLLNNTINSSHI